MGYVDPASYYNHKLIVVCKSEPKLICIRLYFWRTRLKCHTNCTPRYKSTCTYQTNVRPSWAPNGEIGWYVGPSMYHYRCIQYYFPITRACRDVDTVTFISKVVPFPEVKIDNFLKQVALDIISILTNQPLTTTINLEGGDTTRNALLNAAQAL